jgi:hypothetical protein
MVGPLRIALQQCGGPLGTHTNMLRAGMDTMQTTCATLDDSEVAALASVDQAATDARQELNKTVAEAKTEVGADFGRVFAPRCTARAGRRPLLLPLRTQGSIDCFCLRFTISCAGATHVCICYLREPIPHGASHSW